MTFQQFKSSQSVLRCAVDLASEKLRSFPRLPNGLTPDDVRQTPEYRLAKCTFDLAFSAERAFNGQWVKRFKREIRDDLHARRMAVVSK